ncbi:MAG TPA: Rieske 2Fe-2S domain-containing protein [Myxococcales bacterium]|nr:Rieske 2Fe-2S domain-containing protein [Myxococcales bacterium]
MSSLTRRSMLRTAALVPLAARLGCARRISPDREVSVAPLVDGDLTITLAQAPELSSAGGAVVARIPGLSGGILVANTGTGYLALAATCPHEQCDVAWVAEDRQAECPCHGSRFAGDGTVLHPPATANLASYPAEADGQGNVVVHTFAGEGALKDLSVSGGQFSFPLARFPALQDVGGIVAGRPNGFPAPLLITRLTAGTGPDAIGAVDAVCTHQGCTVLPAASSLQCPCHGSVFDLAGVRDNTKGPEGTYPNLFRYAVDFDGTTVTISTQFRS